MSGNLDGTLVRTGNGTAGGSIIAVRATDDLEHSRGNSKGAVQGYGYEFHKGESRRFAESCYAPGR